MWWPEVGKRMRQEVRPDYYVSQLLSGHRDFREKLRLFGLRSRGDCECGERREKAEHELTVCKSWKQERKATIDKINSTGEWNREVYERLLTGDDFKALAEFAKEVMSRKQEGSQIARVGNWVELRFDALI